MKSKFAPNPTTLALSCALAIAVSVSVSACGEKNDDAAAIDPPAGAQSTYGKMLEAAENTAKRANEHSEKLKETADSAGE